MVILLNELVSDEKIEIRYSKEVKQSDIKIKTSMGCGNQENHLNKPLNSNYPISSVCDSKQFAHGDSCRFGESILVFI